jgi:hypothetical protein
MVSIIGAMFTAALAALALAVAPAQDPPRPRPFPGSAPPPSSSTSSSQPATPSGAAPQTAAAQGAVDPDTGVPLYPDAVLIGKFEAGPGQPFYLYGSQSSYTNIVEFYRGALKDRGRALFGGPMHQFDLGRYRRETMVLQPAVTVKDYTWNGREGYIHVDGLATTKFPTVIQIAPAPPVR